MTQPFWICTALNAIALVVWALLFLERSPWGRSPVSDYGSAVGLVVLFFLVPLTGARVWWLGRRRREPSTGWRRRYLRVSVAFLAVTWVASLIPMLFWAGILAAVASQRWPINVREGPDTEFAKEGFREHFGFPPTGVDGLYYQRGWEFGDGNTHRMKFHFRDAAVIENIVRAAGLEPVPELELRDAWVVDSDPPDWWPRQDSSGDDQVFRRGSRPRLWVDREIGTAYHRSWP